MLCQLLSFTRAAPRQTTPNTFLPKLEIRVRALNHTPADGQFVEKPALPASAVLRIPHRTMHSKKLFNSWALQIVSMQLLLNHVMLRASLPAIPTYYELERTEKIIFPGFGLQSTFAPPPSLHIPMACQ